jgi:hypothetical protein
LKLAPPEPRQEGVRGGLTVKQNNKKPFKVRQFTAEVIL